MQTQKLIKTSLAAVFFTILLSAVCFAGAASKKQVYAASVQISNIRYDDYTLRAGKTKKLKANLAPSNTTKKKLKWTSSNKAVATVSSDGVITAKSEGVAVIKVSTRYTKRKNRTDSITLTVGMPARSISVASANVSLISGQKHNMNAAVLPDTAANKGIKYASSKTSVASVSKNGRINAKRSGTAVITAYSADSRVKKSVTVNSEYENYYYTLKLGEKKGFFKKIATDSYIKNKKIQYSSSNKSVATVSKNGVIRAKSKGTATITAAVKGGFRKATIQLTVGTPVTKIQPYDTDVARVTKGSTLKLSPAITPSYATNKKLLYTSSDESIATVSSTGRITGVKAGSCVVTIKSQDMGASAALNVTVYNEFDMLVSTEYGKTQGYIKNSACAWYDIPFAKPPVGELRWKAPQDPEPWSGTLKNTSGQKKCAQTNSGVFSGDEDCLYLNIYRPNTDETNLPVMVYVHGGSNLHSGKNGFAGANVAVQTNSVVVTINYRLGAFGFFNVNAIKSGDPESDSGNFAILDIKKSLEFVQKTIEDFGGDKNNVTLAGFSAGSKNVAACIISPLFKGLFHKVIMWSGSANIAAPEEGEQSALYGVAKILYNKKEFSSISEAQQHLLSLNDDELKELLYSLSAEEISQIYVSTLNKPNGIKYVFTDGYVIPEDGFDVIRRGEHNSVPVMIGGCRSEESGFFYSASYFNNGLYTKEFEQNIVLSHSAMLGKYYGGLLYTAYNTDATAKLLYSAPNAQPIYAYRFLWGENAEVTGEEYFSTYVGAHHGMDLDFVEGSFSNGYKSIAPNLFSSENADGRKDLSAALQNYIGNFMRNGDPNGYELTEWEPWNDQPGVDKIMMLDANKTKRITAMSDEYYDIHEVMQRANHELTVTLVDTFFSHRFFYLFINLLT